ncbi:MAG: TetR/AcrR family transcriptional regulator [Microbacterium sp.]|uniref:TetR/AcrR family transcriptional regulator n=1 Tax=Microbacterium sp. TaxID=51671 RepID=UPI001AD33F1B|nr:TetR/AcrR family transcriptional regulator [Microbacterium sp.]MBN9153957.1 TetR/AcrR family transcriptional regulator [Microbacterium sp.]MBN9173045.1 TetR/AcrR family transcriptional regulator [Microbacterium sp.]
MSSAPDPRIARTRRDVIGAAVDVLAQSGWEQVTHGEIARRSGYAKATIYAHWPTRLDLVRDAVDRICDESSHPVPTGDLRADLVAGLRDFADDLSTGSLARVLGGVLERSGTDPVVDELRQRLYESGTSGLRAVLAAHLAARDVAPVLAMLTGGVLVRVAFEGKRADAAFIHALVERALATTSLTAS